MSDVHIASYIKSGGKFIPESTLRAEGKVSRFSCIAIVTAASIALAACSLESGGDANAEMSPDQVLVSSKGIPLPGSATDIKQYRRDFISPRLFVHFKASKEDIDKFSVEVLAGAKVENNYDTIYFVETANVSWWPRRSIPGARGGIQDGDGEGIREVTIVDHPGYSELWLYDTSS